MDYPLTINAILRRAEQFAADREVVTRLPDRSFHRYTYADLARRARRLGSALRSLGLGPGDRVATMCFSHHQHAEAYYGIPLAGLTAHPVNPRLHADDIAYITTHARDQVLIIDESLLGVYQQIRDRASFRQVVVVGADDPPPGTVGYEDLLAGGDPDTGFPDPDERAAALVTYTSGTTGRPKGVEASHRAIVLHTLSISLRGWMAFTDSDVVMPVVPMFHALAWGWPYNCGLLGAKLVLPGPLLDPVSLLENIEAERVTVTGGVPTVWAGLLDALDAQPGRFEVSSLRAVLSGGATAPPSMIQAYRERHDIPFIHTWGMTEMIMGAISELTWDLADSEPDVQQRQREKQGRPMPLVEVRARGDDGLVSWDGRSMGELEVRGPWVAGAYLDDADATADRWTADGWFRTGDIVTIDRHGYIDIADRAKDLIKSGGEWISTPVLESALMAHPAVAEAAVVGVADSKWTERPLAVVALRPGGHATAEELREFITPHVARWWLPEKIEFVPALPRTAVGKYDKIALRRHYGAAPSSSQAQ